MENDRFTFGRYKGQKVTDVYEKDKSYTDWFLTQPDMISKYKIIHQCIINCQNNDDNFSNNIKKCEKMNNIKKSQNINNIQKSIIISNTNIKNDEFQYGDYINFQEEIIRSAIIKLGISEDCCNNFLFEIKNNNIDNINKDISVYSDNYIDKNINNYDENFIKISLAWKYGICAYDDKPFSKSVIKSIIEDIIDKNKPIDECINKLTEKLKETEKINLLNIGMPLTRKICKSLPFLFTPALFQFYLLGLTNKEIKKIHKCKRDKVMNGINRSFPNKKQKINDFYELDWQKEYYSFVINPYAYYTIDLITCDKVIEVTRRSINNFKYEIYLGQVSRTTYDKVKVNKWSCTPLWVINEKNPISDEQMLKMLESNYGLIFDMESFYLRHIHQQETDISEFISEKLNTKISKHKIDNFFEDKLSQEQKDAIETSLSEPITVINAKAGTGKTTIIKEIVKQLRNNSNTEFVICSFTAKAVKRVQEVLGEHEIIMNKDNKDSKSTSCVRTIHSLMSAVQKQTIEIPKCVIIDEASMVSLSLLSELLNKLRYYDFNLIMLGDINQLPPIKYGRPFEDIINSGCISSPKLTRNFRVIGDGIKDNPIIINSHNIIEKNYKIIEADNFQLSTVNDNNFKEKIQIILQEENITNTNFTKKLDEENKSTTKIKFITNTNDNNTKLNIYISEFIGDKNNKRNISCWINDKDKDGKKIKKKISMSYAIGDPVVFTKNNVYHGTLNGDEGTIHDFVEIEGVEYMLISLNTKVSSIPNISTTNKNNDENLIKVRMYHDQYTTYTVKHILLAYSITVHKSQGSEYEDVYFYIDGKQGPMFNNKRLTYTAITRSSNKCNIIEGKDQLYEQCCRTQIAKHYGNLDKRISSNL